MDDDRAALWAVVLTICVAVILFTQECRSRAAALPSAREELVRIVEIESENPVDQAAIPHVLHRRWMITRRTQGWTFAQQVVRYSRPLRAWFEGVPFRPFSPRQLRILNQPRRSSYELVDRFLRGELVDPCIGAMHWAARSLPCPLVPVECTSRTTNQFYNGP